MKPSILLIRILMLAFFLILPVRRVSADMEFRGYPCSQNCTGHDAGYAWAQSQRVTDAGECAGESETFVAGCQAYVKALHEEDDKEEPEEDEKNDDEDEADEGFTALS